VSIRSAPAYGSFETTGIGARAAKDGNEVQAIAMMKKRIILQDRDARFSIISPYAIA
jgi:hypothetical protein